MKFKNVIAMLSAGLILGLLSGWLLPCIGAAGVVCATVPLLAKGADTANVIKGLKEERGALIESMDAMLNLSETESRSFSDAEDKDYKEHDKNLRSFTERIERLEGKMKREMEGAGNIKDKNDNQQTEERAAQERKIYRTYLQRGMGGLSQEDREFMEQRAMSSATGDDGGYLIPEGFANDVDVALKSFGGILTAASFMSTTTGNKISFPTMDDTNNMGARIDENTSAGASVSPKVGTVPLEAHTYSSKPILVPNQLLQDSAFNLEGYLRDMMVKRISRIANKEFTTGTGTGQPAGILTKSTVGATALSDAITYDNLIDLKYSVDEEYRLNGSWMLNDNTLKALSKLKDANGSPIWVESLRTGEPSLLLGKPYIVSNEMEDVATGKKSILFGDLKKYLIREVAGSSILRLTERYAEFNQTAFIMFKRLDGKLIDAGTHPVKHLAHA